MSARLGHRGLTRLRDQLSDRDREVIHSVASHRFMSGKQLERLHFHEHATADTGARVARTVLARLARQRVLARLERRVGGIRAGSASHVYSLGPIGRRLVGEQTARQVREPSPAFLEHTLAIVEAHLALVEAARAGRLELVSVEVEPACWRRYLNAGGGQEVLRPDHYVVTAERDYEYCWFIEIDRGTEYAPTLLRKCRAYQTYWRTGLEQQRSGTFPRVLWLAPDSRRVAAIERVLGSARGLERDLFWVAVEGELVERVVGGAG